MSEVKVLQDALQYLTSVIQWRLNDYFADDSQRSATLAQAPAPPNDWLLNDTALAKTIKTHQFNSAEQITLLMALAPHLQADFFDRAITAQLPEAGDYPQIGGARSAHHRGFLPTGETVLFILGGRGLSDRIHFQSLFSPEHPFAQHNILALQTTTDNEPSLSGRLILSPDYISLFFYGSMPAPRFSISFPAQRITTDMDWDDLVLNTQTQHQIQEIQTWITHSPTLLHDWGMKRQLKSGYRALFYGPPGTGKTLTASLLGKYTQKQVYKIDISMVVSKFIGETEKNLANLFAQAESKDWILFFDEADALFGKRTSVRDAHDKYANQEVSYLLQRIESYDGLVILASNLKRNIDEAFLRRFQSIIHFPLPDASGRSRLWQQAFPSEVKLDAAIDFSELSDKYELSGADILNVVQYCCLQALERGDRIIAEADLRRAIKREFNKVGKILT